MKQGTVKFFNQVKGFGFITDADGDQDYFVHSTGLTEQVKDGDSVEFELEDDPKGKRAVNVKLAE
ncbi:MAG: cold-shock protein [Flavobacteriales bacterium]|jgi:CspA family cold shock protein|nr:cold-shock protein [Flavobacteriales bacterium]|tara:strand:- start:1241 stop:1435 length:195 start_codon:yes stop_codon:yes gene_type:complete